MSEKYIKKCRDLNYFEYFLILISSTNGFVLIFAFASLVGVLVGLAKFSGTIKNFCNHCKN